MTCTETYADDAIRLLVEKKLQEDPNFMPQMLAKELNVPMLRIIRALPDAMRAHTSGSAFIAIWEAMAEWEKVTFMAETPGAILEIPCRLPKGKMGHGMYNLMDKTTPLGGHLLLSQIDSIWFVSKQVFGLESHSVQFFDANGHQCFAVFLGRDEQRALIPSVKEGFLALKAEHACECACNGGACCNESTVEQENDVKTLIVYSSRTGNTRMIAEAIREAAPKNAQLFPVQEAPDPAGFDLVALGFWVDRGEPDTAMAEYMKRVQGTPVALFGTLGAWADSDHARECMGKAAAFMEGNTVLGTFMCQGKVDPKVLAAMARMPEAQQNHPMTEDRKARIAEAAKHPDANDCAAAQAFFADVLTKATAHK